MCDEKEGQNNMANREPREREHKANTVVRMPRGGQQRELLLA